MEAATTARDEAAAVLKEATTAAKGAVGPDKDRLDEAVADAQQRFDQAKTTYDNAVTVHTNATTAKAPLVTSAKLAAERAADAAKVAAAAEAAVPGVTQDVTVAALSPDEVKENRKATYEFLRPTSGTLVVAMLVLWLLSLLFALVRSSFGGWAEHPGPWSLTFTLLFWAALLVLLDKIGNARNLEPAGEGVPGAMKKLAARRPSKRKAKRALDNPVRAERPGVYDFVIGKDGRLSTSQTQAFGWTFLLAGAFVYFVARAAITPGGDSTLESLGTSFQTLDASYLLLLGGPFAAAVGAGLITQKKVDAESVQKVEAEQTKLRDVLTNDAGSGDLVDAQFFVFNLVAMIWFVVAIKGTPDALPEIPPALVALTSLSALTYTAAKAAADNTPAVTAVTLMNPQAGGTDDIRPGDLVEIRGVNFMPPGSDSVSAIKRLRVRFGTMTVIPEVTPQATEPTTGVVYATYPSNTLLVARVPLSTTPATIPVSVLTGADVESAPTMVVVGTDKPVITSIEPTILHRGKSVIIRGRFFLRPSVARTDGSLPSVTFGGVPVKASRWSSDGLGVVVKVPMGAKPGEKVKLTVQAAGAIGPSEPIDVHIED